jgi:hypothetical protein
MRRRVPDTISIGSLPSALRGNIRAGHAGVPLATALALAAAAGIIHPGGSSIGRTVMADPITERATSHYPVKVCPSERLYIARDPIDRLPHPGQGLSASEAFRLTPRAAWSNDTIATPADQERASELRPGAPQGRGASHGWGCTRTYVSTPIPSWPRGTGDAPRGLTRLTSRKPGHSSTPRCPKVASEGEGGFTPPPDPFPIRPAALFSACSPPLSLTSAATACYGGLPAERLREGAEVGFTT